MNESARTVLIVGASRGIGRATVGYLADRDFAVGGGGSSILAMPLSGVGCASRFAVEAMCDSLRLETRGAGVHVSLVQPGMTYGPEDAAAFRRDKDADIDAVTRKIPAATQTYYRPVLDRMRTFYDSWLERAAPPEVVSRRIHHALTARIPRTRYWCGSESWASVALARLSPGRARDAIWGRMVGL